MSETNFKEFKGYNGILVLTENAVIIKRSGFMSFFSNLKGDKTIFYNSIVAVQLKKPGAFTVGYLQLTLKGAGEANNGVMAAVQDENSVTFNESSRVQFEEAKSLIEEKINNLNNPTKSNNLDELEKLANLKEKGVITEEEFNAKKKQILAI